MRKRIVHIFGWTCLAHWQQYSSYIIPVCTWSGQYQAKFNLVTIHALLVWWHTMCQATKSDHPNQFCSILPGIERWGSVMTGTPKGLIYTITTKEQCWWSLCLIFNRFCAFYHIHRHKHDKDIKPIGEQFPQYLYVLF